MRAFEGDALSKFASCGWRNGAGIHDNHAFGERLFDSVRPEEHAFNSGSVGDSHPGDFGALCRFCRSGGGASAFDFLAGRTIPDGDLVSSFDKITCHLMAPDSPTQKCDSHRRTPEFIKKQELE